MNDYSGKDCSGCGKFIGYYDDVKVCVCGAPYHKECWEKVQKCSKCNSNDKTEKITTAYSSTDSSMFSNIGGKLKGLATFITIVGIIGGIITMFVIGFSDDDMIFPGFLTGLLIGLISWIGSFALYGFGALISYTQENNVLLSIIAKKLNDKEK